MTLAHQNAQHKHGDVARNGGAGQGGRERRPAGGALAYRLAALPFSPSVLTAARARALPARPPRQTLLFSKGQVYVHPSLNSRDNIAGFLSIIQQVRPRPALHPARPHTRSRSAARVVLDPHTRRATAASCSRGRRTVSWTSRTWRCSAPPRRAQHLGTRSSSTCPCPTLPMVGPQPRPRAVRNVALRPARGGSGPQA